METCLISPWLLILKTTSKVQVLFGCCTLDTCNWVRQGAGGGGVRKEKNKQTQREETYLVQLS